MPAVIQKIAMRLLLNYALKKLKLIYILMIYHF